MIVSSWPYGAISDETEGFEIPRATNGQMNHSSLLASNSQVGMIRGTNMRWLLSVATMAVVLAGCASPGATPSATASPTASATEPASSSSPAASAIVIDRLARPTVNSLTLRARPGTAGAQLGTIDAGQLGFVVAGPASADGYAWYQLAGVGLPPSAGCEPPVVTTPFSCPDWLGWVAAGQPGQPWLEATTLPCPASLMNLDALVNETALERLACYGSTPIRFRGWWPQIPPGAGLGGTCGATPKPSPAWLFCQNINYNGLVISESAGFEGVGLKISIDPASGVTMPTRGQWVEVVAHLDDRAAQDCTPAGGGEQDPVKVVLTCRGELVAESVKPVVGPY
jgi:hypothetical protein